MALRASGLRVPELCSQLCSRDELPLFSAAEADVLCRLLRARHVCDASNKARERTTTKRSGSAVVVSRPAYLARERVLIADPASAHQLWPPTPGQVLGGAPLERVRAYRFLTAVEIDNRGRATHGRCLEITGRAVDRKDQRQRSRPRFTGAWSACIAGRGLSRRRPEIGRGGLEPPASAAEPTERCETRVGA